MRSATATKQPSALRWLWVAALVLLLDQGSKAWILATMQDYQSIDVLPFLNWYLVYNTGAAFSFLAGESGWQQWFFIGLALTIAIAIVIWLSKLPVRPTLEPLALTCILGGALGNLIDRLLQGKVTDFIDFHVAGWHFATFNIADMAISLGAFFMLLHIWLHRHDNANYPAPPAN